MNLKFKKLLSAIALILAFALCFTSCEGLIPNDTLGDGNVGEQNNDKNNTSEGSSSTNDPTDLEDDLNTDSGSTDSGSTDSGSTDSGSNIDESKGFDYNAVPAYSGSAYYVYNNGKPFFTESEIVTESYETYGALDSLGRCTTVVSCIGKDIMPTEERGNISSVNPTGWEQVQYPTNIVPGGYLYNRCHLIGHQLTGEDANKSNLITGTKYFNTAMIPFENMVADYIKETNNHVMYRVTPVFVGNDLLASGILLEAYSVEDDGDGISLNIFFYNVQPGVVIDYATGNSWQEGKEPEGDNAGSVERDYVLNTSSKKVHTPDCTHASKISDKNREEYTGYVQDLLDEGYTKCGSCNPD